MRRNKLLLARKSKGLTQEEAAGLLGVSRNAWSRWEQGKEDPYPIHAGALCTFFGVQTLESLDLGPSRSQTEPIALPGQGQGLAERDECTTKEDQKVFQCVIPSEGLISPEPVALEMPDYSPIVWSSSQKSVVDLTVPVSVSKNDFSLFIEVASGDCATWFSEKLVLLVAFVTQRQRRLRISDFQKMVDRELRVFDEIKMMFDPDTYFLSRRSALLKGGVTNQR